MTLAVAAAGTDAGSIIPDVTGAATGSGAAVFGCSGQSLTPAEAAFFRAADPFGFILFARNIDNPAQVSRLIADLRSAVGRQAPVMVDQEGGRVQRLRAPHWRELPPPLDLAQAQGDADLAVEALVLSARLIAADLTSLGFDANCAPVADIAGPDTHPVLRNRCYGTEPAFVARAARAIADAYLAAGVLPVAKHMPGHGRSHIDTHLALPRVEEDLDTLRATDFVPFRALRDLPMAMTAHIVFAALDPDHPATQSAAVVKTIRSEIGFDGLLLTDDLNMQALEGDLTQRTNRAMRAGCDIALHCNGDLAQMERVASAAGAMSDATRRRAVAALRLRREAGALDFPATVARLAELGGKIAHV